MKRHMALWYSQIYEVDFHLQPIKKPALGGFFSSSKYQLTLAASSPDA